MEWGAKAKRNTDTSTVTLVSRFPPAFPPLCVEFLSFWEGGIYRGRTREERREEASHASDPKGSADSTCPTETIS